MPDPHLQPWSDRIRVQKMVNPSQEASYEEGNTIFLLLFLLSLQLHR